MIQMEEVHLFKPNDITHKAFGDALRNAEKKGVKIIAVNCKTEKDSIVISEEIEVEL